MARKRKKRERLAADRPSVDRVTNREFIEQNLIIAPEIGRSVRRSESTEDLIKGMRWLTPLEILEVYANDPRTVTKHRIEAAKAAAPYRHKKMPQAVEFSGTLTLAQLVAQSAKPEKEKAA